jgi:hypothetical protein
VAEVELAQHHAAGDDGDALGGHEIADQQGGQADSQAERAGEWWCGNAQTADRGGGPDETCFVGVPTFPQIGVAGFALSETMGKGFGAGWGCGVWEEVDYGSAWGWLSVGVQVQGGEAEGERAVFGAHGKAVEAQEAWVFKDQLDPVPGFEHAWGDEAAQMRGAGDALPAEIGPVQLDFDVLGGNQTLSEAWGQV